MVLLILHIILELPFQHKIQPLLWLVGRFKHLTFDYAAVRGIPMRTPRHSCGQAFSIRTNRQPKGNSLTATSPQLTVDLNTAALDQFRNVGYNDAYCVKVYTEARLDVDSKVVNMRLGILEGMGMMLGTFNLFLAILNSRGQVTTPREVTGPDRAL